MGHGEKSSHLRELTLFPQNGFTLSRQTQMDRLNDSRHVLSQPGAAQDHLYEPDYMHLKPGVSCDECGCNPSQQVQRPTDDEDDELYIIVQGGTIASGKKLEAETSH